MRKNLIWAGSLRGVVRGLTIVKTLILARILTPAQFGIFGIATLILGILETVSETGVNVILIQEKKTINHYVNTAWVVSILRGILISLIIILLSPLIVVFFDSPKSLDSLFLISLIPLIRGFINPSVVSYQKNLEFNKEFKFRTILISFEVIATVIFGLILRNETALVLGMICSAIVEVVLSFKLLRPLPKFEFNIDKLKKVISLGKWITGAKIFDYLFSHGDDIVVGKLLGTFSLGIYQQAYKISTLPITEIAETFQKVTFPLYSKMVADNKSIKKIYLKTFLTTLLIVIPFSLILFLIPEKIVLILLGSNWLSAVPVLQVLAIFAIVKTIANGTFPVLLSYKRQDLVMLLTLIGIIGLGISIYPLINLYSLVGAGLATIIGSIVMIPPAFYWTRKLLR
jgi:O-antigen/teichoic acid export membrane protein